MTWSGEANAALMMVTGKNGPPTLTEAATQLGLDLDAFDPDFGVVTINPDRSQYSVRVDASRLSSNFETDRGPFSDPEIAPMGPPEE